MTVQASDFVWYKGKKYTLVDCERGKCLIGSAPFPVERNAIASTACKRGYTAEYFIEENHIYGMKSVVVVDDPSIDYFTPGRKITSEKLPLNYTGSIVTACDESGSFHISDFLECLLDYDEALELYFVDGKIVEERSLLSAIQEWRKFKSEVLSAIIGQPEERSKRIITRRDLTNKYLKYEYGNRNTYKWRESIAE